MIKVINIISDTNIGGAGKCLLNYLSRYDRSVIDMTVALPRSSQLISELNKLCVPYEELDHINEKSLSLSAIWRELLKYFNKVKPDLIHTHAVMSARIAARIYGTGTFTIHTRHSVFPQPGAFKTFPIKQMMGFLNNSLSDKIVAVSPAAKDNLIEIGTDAAKIVTIFNGVSKVIKLDETEIQAIRRTYGLDESDFVVSIIARIEKVKGHRYLLDCAAELLNTGIKFLIAGTGSCEQELRARVRDEHISNVIFAGFINDIYKIENISDIQINCSYGTEATSLSLLEGMSIGLPAIVSNYGGNPYVIEHGVNGLIVPKCDYRALKNAILRLKDNPNELIKLKDGAYKVFYNKFTIDRMCSQITQLYTELASKTKKKGLL